MCWRTYYGMLSVQRTATKDIPVRKAFVVTEHAIRSLCFSGFRWTKGILRKTYLGNVRKFPIAKISNSYTPHCHAWSIEEGFHSAKDVKIYDCYMGRTRLKVSNGKKFGRVFSIGNKTDIKILNCIIPKSSKYYVNEYGEYVSDQLIVLLNS